MSINPILPAILVATISCPAFAQNFSGGELGLEYNVNPQNTSSDNASYTAGLEFSLGQEYGVSFTAQSTDFLGDDSSSKVTVHGLYHLNPGATVGLFYSQDDNDVAGYGIEGGTVLGAGEIGGYIGQRSYDGQNVTIIGFESRTAMADNMTFFTDFDLVTDSSAGTSTSELGISYEFDQGPEAYVQLGRSSIFNDDSSVSTEGYIGIGARISFGAKRGTTFEGR